MSDLIVVGGEDNSTQALPEEEIVLAMYEHAKQLGMDFREYLANQIDKWSPEDFIRESYEAFLKAVQNGEEKPWPTDSGDRWNEHSTFEEWLAVQKKVAEVRLEQVRQQRKNPPPSFPKLAKLVDEAEKYGADLNLVVEGVGETPEQWVYEFYEEILRKSIEAINSFMAGELKLPSSYSWGDIDYPEKFEVDTITEEEAQRIRETVRKTLLRQRGLT